MFSFDLSRILQGTLSALLVSFALGAGSASAQIERDGSGTQVQGLLTPTAGVYTILGEDGIRSGSNNQLLLHSFSDFNLTANETARFDDDAQNLENVTNILARITGNNASQLDGHIESLYPNADLLFMNPNGVFFGSSFTLDVQQGFHVSTADYLELRDTVTNNINVITSSEFDVLPDLEMAVPSAWGFISAQPADITIGGFGAVDASSVTSDRVFSFVGGNVTIGDPVNAVGGDIVTDGRSLNIVAIGQQGRVVNFSSAAGIGPDSLNVTDSALLPSQAIGVLSMYGDSGISTSGTNIRNGDVLLSGGNVELFSLSRGIRTAAESGSSRDAGAVFVYGTDIAIDLSIDTSATFGNGGDVVIEGQDTIAFGSPNRVDEIATSATRTGTTSGSIAMSTLNNGGSISISNARLEPSSGFADGDAQFVSLLSDSISMLDDSTIFGNTDGDATPLTITIEGDTVDLTGAEFFANTILSSPGHTGAQIDITGNDQLDLTGVFITARAFGFGSPNGVGNGGDIVLTSPNFVGFDPNVDPELQGVLVNLSGGEGGPGSITINDGSPAGQIVRDDTPGQDNVGAIDPVSGVYTIHGDDGVRTGDNDSLLVHSFSDFNLDASETALYTDGTLELTNTKTVLTRITGNNPSQLDGTIESDYFDADLYFVNPNGLFFGSTFTLDVAQGFHVSTADSLDVLDGNGLARLDMTSEELVPVITGPGTPVSWGFDSAGSDKIIHVSGFDVALGTPDLGKSISFVGGDVLFEPSNDLALATQGRNLVVAAIGRPGRVEGFADDSGSDLVPLFTPVNGGLAILPIGDIVVNDRVSIDTAGLNASNGDVVMYGGTLDIAAGAIATRSAQAFAQDAGGVFLLGIDVDLQTSIDTRSDLGDGGEVIVQGFNTLNVGSSDDIFSINTTASAAGTEHGAVFMSGTSVDIQNVVITAGDGIAQGDGSTVFLTGDSVNFISSTINGITTGDAIAQSVVIQGRVVDVTNSTVNINTTGTTVEGGNFLLIGTESLDVSGGFASAVAEGSGNGGTIVLQSAEFLDSGNSDHDVSALGGGAEGTYIEILLDAPPGGDGPPATIPDDAIIPTFENDFAAALPPDLGDLPLDDFVGFGDLQPTDIPTDIAATAPTPGDVAAAGPADDAPGDEAEDDDESIQFAVATAGAGGTGEPVSGSVAGSGTATTGTSSASGTGGGEGDSSSGEFASSSETEAQIAEAASSSEAASAKKDKSSAIPGVSLFTNASQSAPLVPRTCEVLAGGAKPSKLLARASKRLPTSPEDWLMAFDTTGDRLLAAAEAGALPSVAAVDANSDMLAETERNTRTQRALVAAAVAVRGGRYDEASMSFEEAVAALEDAGDEQGASEALLAFAQLQQNDGRYVAARQSLERALAIAEALGDEAHIGAIRSSLGNALIGTGDLARAEDELTRGLNIAMSSKDDQPAPAVLNNLGNRHAATQDWQSALWAYERSAKLARKLGRTGDEARALSGAARAAADSGHLTDAAKLLDRAMLLAAKIEVPRESVPLYIHMGRTYAQFAAVSPIARKRSLLSAYDAFDAALKGAEVTGDLRSIALANLNLGALYSEEQHRSEALYLTRLARRAAEGINAPELLYRAHWQEGQILWADHEIAAALAAHRRAVAILEETKPLASDGYGSSDSAFRIAVGAVYEDTVDIMLQAASLTSNTAHSQQLIVEARDTLEKLKSAELRDYFEDECIASVKGDGRSLHALGEDAAVVYTVTLPDRIELLVGLPSGVERFTTNVPAVKLEKTVDEFRRAVQNPLSNRHRNLGRTIYDWIVAPYAKRIADAGIETLVFIPDGRLRTLPFAALSDGEHYLSEKYATATALSLRLLSSPDLASETGRPVLAGVSESVQGFSALAAVGSELAEIQAIEGDGELLLNEAFTLDEVRAAVNREIPGVVHLATHAVFTGNPDTSFLLTYDGRVGFDDLSDVVGMTRADGAPLDLLVLSACETAVGNDRAGLGFTGSAIRAGARSALGSLWPISDAAARELMVDFYRGLQSPELTKAEALRRAQATLRDNERFEHPFYWAPFTLVNDWM